MGSGLEIPRHQHVNNLDGSCPTYITHIWSVHYTANSHLPWSTSIAPTSLFSNPPPTLAALLSLNPIHLHSHLPALMYSVDSPLPGCLLHRFSFSTDCMTTICFPGLGMPSVPSLESLRLCCRFKSQSIQELELMSSLSEG